MAAALNTTVPTRFLATVAHLMAIAMIFYSMDDNIRAGLSLNYSQSDYDAAERQYAFGAQSGRAARTPTHAPPPRFARRTQPYCQPLSLPCLHGH